MKLRICSLSGRVAVLWASVGVAAPAFGQATFRRVGDLEGGRMYSRAVVVSGDGKVAAGESVADGAGFFGIAPAFRITDETRITELDKGYHEFSSLALAISADGRVIAGDIVTAPSFEVQAFVWTPEGGMEVIGDLPGGATSGYIRGMTADGSMLVGLGSSTESQASCGGCTEAFVWTRAEAFRALGDVEGGVMSSRAYGVTPDGKVVIGHVTAEKELPEAARWTNSGGWERLGFVDGWRKGASSEAFDVSADGGVIVGRSSNARVDYEAFVWTHEGGMVGLGDLPGGNESSVARAVSADGGTIVGIGSEDGDGGPFGGAATRAFVWTKAGGMRNLKEVLETEGGLDLSGYDLVSAWDVSADGRTIVGEAIVPEGWVEGYIATLPAPGCRPDCNGDGVLNVNDFICFQAEWRKKSVYGDYDGSGAYTVNDFIRFQAEFAKGCG